MDQQETLLVDRLRAVPSPREMHDWAGRDGYYVAACRVAAADVPGLIDVVRRWKDWEWSDDTDELDDELDEELEDESDGELDDESDGELDYVSEDEQLLPVTAWRTLADLRAEAAIEPLIALLLETSGDEYDDWLSEELPHVFGKIGEASIEPLVRVVRDADLDEFGRSPAVRGLRYVAEYHPQTRDGIVAFLTEMMAAADEDVEFNTTLLTELVDLHAVEAAEPIERAFAADLIDVGMMGDWEKVRKKLGVEGLRLEMPERPVNSMERWRINMGIGIFSDRGLFKYNEIDREAEPAYYRRAWDTFSKSPDAQVIVDRFGDLCWFRALLEYGLNYLGECVDAMEVESVAGFVLEHVPRKFSTEPDEAAAIVAELTAFWEYLDRVYQLPNAEPIVGWLKSGGVVRRLEAALSDTSNFGMAKSIVMMGKDAGYDMTSQAGLDAFMLAYNSSLLAKRSPRIASPSPSPPAARPLAAKQEGKQKVGRNDPCPCGSGKKFKKCCL